MKELTLKDCFEQSIDLYCHRVEEGDLDLAATAAAHAEHYLETIYLMEQISTSLCPNE